VDKLIRFGSIDWNEDCKNAIYDLINVSEPQLTMGKNVNLFETQFAKWLGSKYAVFMNSGTSAVMAAIQSVKDIYIKEDILPCYVRTTALTYPADWNAIQYCGLKVCGQDVTDQMVMNVGNGRQTNINEISMPVHLLGKPCHNIQHIATDIEDTCESLGSSINGRKLGTFGHCGVFSFYVSHQMTTIEGGMVVTNNPDLYENLLSARDNGRLCVCPQCTLKFVGKCKKRYAQETHKNERRWATGTVIGGNFKPTEFQGALGCVRMKTLDENVGRRNKIFLRYAEEFDTIIQEKGEFIVPIAYPVKVRNPSTACEHLEFEGIEARGMFPSFGPKFKNATKISETHILIPLHHNMSDEDVETVIGTVKKCQNL
jgi:dTDP-4-amino-4,6-dideoxygalactose transaminase